jgi:hypothetical protein
LVREFEWEFSPGEELVNPPNDLHVLLRHRPRSISRLRDRRFPWKAPTCGHLLVSRRTEDLLAIVLTRSCPLGTSRVLAPKSTYIRAHRQGSDPVIDAYSCLRIPRFAIRRSAVRARLAPLWPSPPGLALLPLCLRTDIAALRWRV